MENLEGVKSFLRDLITPIVEKAVKSAMPEKKKDIPDGYLSISQIEEKYHVSYGTIYRRFESGELTKVKNGGRTLVEVAELERVLKKGRLASVDESGYKRYSKRVM